MRFFKLAAVFVLSLLLFALSYSFYASVELQLEGRAQPGTKLTIAFSQGEEFRPYEKTVIELAKDQAAEVDGMAHVFLKHTLPNVQLTKIQLTSDRPLLLSSLGARMDTQEKSYGAAEVRPEAPLNLDGKEFKAKRFHLGVLSLQLVVAGLVTYAFAQLSAFLRRFRRETIGDTLRALMIEEGRWVFWLSFLGATFVHSLWLLAYWPAAMTNDSWASLYEIRALELKDWHPYIYALYLMALMQFGDTIGAVGLFQVLLTAGLCSFVFYHCYKNGVRFLFLAPFILLFIFSIPIGLYNIILWKDVPFSVMTLAVSIGLYLVQRERERTGQYARIPSGSILWIVLGLVLLLHSRHNGAIFFVGLPLVFFRRISRRAYAGLLAILVCSFVFVGKVIPHTFNIPKTHGSAYHELKTILSIMTHFNYYSETRAEDIKAVEAFVGTDWATINSLFPKQWFAINNHPEVTRHQFAFREDDPTNIKRSFLFRLMLQNLPIFLSTRTFEFLHSIGLDCSAFDDRTQYYEDPLQLQGSNLSPPGNMIFNVPLEAESKLPASLTKMIVAVDGWSRKYHGPLSPSFLVWNLAVYLLLFVAILYVERGSSAISVFTLPSLIAAFGVFLAGPGESWRYFYYIYLCGLIAVPLWLEYRKSIIASGR